MFSKYPIELAKFAHTIDGQNVVKFLKVMDKKSNFREPGKQNFDLTRMYPIGKKVLKKQNFLSFRILYPKKFKKEITFKHCINPRIKK